MCEYFSCIVTRKLEIVWDRYKTSHEDLIEKAGLKDDKLEDRDFVRLELVPKEGTILSSKRSDWIYRVDEVGTLPEWYVKNEPYIKEKVWIECQKSFAPYKKNISEVNNFIASLKKIKWFSFSGKISKSWHISFGDNLITARKAAEDAVMDAKWDAAGDAVWDAVWDAKWDAVMDAARRAAEDAVWDAVWDAKWDAALYAKCLLVKNKIAKKHFNHAKERMKVWQAGFGLLCDVNGKLYVYAVKKQ